MQYYHNFHVWWRSVHGPIVSPCMCALFDPSLPITHTELFYFLLSVFVINGPWKGEPHRVAPTEACSRPLVVLWCWSRRGVGDLPDGGGVVRGHWVRVNKMVLFEVTAHCDRTAPVWTQGGPEWENNTSSVLKILPPQPSGYYTAICPMCTNNMYLSNHWVWSVRSTSGSSTVSSRFLSSGNGTKR